MSTKVVFDTNVLVSGHFWKGPPYRCLVAAEAGLVLLVLSTAITSELREKLIEKFGVPAAETEAVIDRLKARAEHVSTPGRSGWVTLDPDDDKFIDAALTAGATIIVSGDRSRRVLAHHRGAGVTVGPGGMAGRGGQSAQVVPLKSADARAPGAFVELQPF